MAREAAAPPRKEVGEAELESLGAALDDLVEFAQCAAWALRAIYAEASPWISVFQDLKTTVQKEACVFKQALVPLSLTIVGGLAAFLLDEYLETDLKTWRRRLPNIVSGAVEQRKLHSLLAAFFRHLATEVQACAPAAVDVLATVLFEARSFEKTRKVLHLQSNVREETWIPLLFVPYVGCFAVPWALKHEDSGASKRICSRSEGESAVAAAWSLTDALQPSLVKVADALEGVSAFFAALLPPLEELSTSTDKESEAWLAETERQMLLLQEKAYRLRLKCLDFGALQSSLDFTLEVVPGLSDEVVDDYVKEWLEAKRAPSELSLLVSIVSARGLPSSSSQDGVPSMGAGGSDPYCVCVVPSKERSALRTRVIRDNLNPVWNFEAALPDYAPGDDLDFLVYDKEFGKEDSVLASYRMPSTLFHPGGFTGDVKLEPRLGTGDTCFLRIKLRVLEAEDAEREVKASSIADKVRDATQSTEILWSLEP